MKIHIILLLLLPYLSNGQTWPSKDCNDRPYIKGNSDTIYHTNDCAVKLKTDTFQFGHLESSSLYVTSSSHAWTIPTARIKTLFYLKGKIVYKNISDGLNITSSIAETANYYGRKVTYDKVFYEIIYQ